MNTIEPKDRLKQIFEETIDSGLKHVGNINELDYYSLLCKSTASNKLYKILNCSVSMFNYEYKDEDSVLIIFSIPITLEVENKHVSERIMDMLKIIEDCFINTDFMCLKNVKEDKFYYLTIVKSLKDDENY